jgi:hypothetical protein
MRNAPAAAAICQDFLPNSGRGGHLVVDQLGLEQGCIPVTIGTDAPGFSVIPLMQPKVHTATVAASVAMRQIALPFRIQ